MKPNKATIDYLELHAGVLSEEQLSKDTGLTVAVVKKRVKEVLKNKPKAQSNELPNPAPVVAPIVPEDWTMKKATQGGFIHDKGSTIMTEKASMKSDPLPGQPVDVPSFAEYIEANKDHIEYIQPKGRKEIKEDE